jgi:hypothetical protein
MDGDVSGDTDQGIAFDLTIGKEWWTGDNWGLGLAGGYTYHSVPDQASSSVDWQGSSYSLRFTATMN